MSGFLRKELIHWRTGLSVLAGALLALAFPDPGWKSLAWIAPAVLIGAALGVAPGRAFRLGCLGGLTYQLVALRWLLNIPFPAGALAGWLALSAYMALYTGLWVWIASKLLPSASLRAAAPGDPSVEAGQPRAVGLATCNRLTGLPWAARTGWALAVAAAWVTVETLAAHLLSGFPWNPLGASQHEMLPLIQIASVTGVAGVSFLVVWVSLGVLLTTLRVAVRAAEPAPLRTHRSPYQPAGTGWPATGRMGAAAFRFTLLADFGLPLLVLFCAGFWGAQRMATEPQPGREVTLALVQPSIPQQMLWDEDETRNRFAKLLDLSRLALVSRPDLLVWPEGMLPTFDEDQYHAMRELVVSNRVWMVFGADDVAAGDDGRPEYFNSAFLLAPDGGHAGTYRKQRLVIFGEYVPLEKWIPWTRYLTPIDGSFTAGPGPVSFRTRGPDAKFSVLICFEDVFARGVRGHVEPDTDFLLNLTNDGWFGEGSAQWQQAAQAVFRAIENGVPLVRCTNNGLTCWIDARGRMRDFLGRGGGDIHAPGFLTVRLPLPAVGTVRPPTLYRRYGDRFAWGCVAAIGGALGLALGRSWLARRDGSQARPR